jgi:hypothetical protein
MRAEASVVIATDNMDCFARAFDRARRRHSPARDCETLASWAVICDDIICSSRVAALKAEDPHAFFGPWLATHGMGFADAVLINDRADNCAAFTGCGGSAIRWKMGTDDISDVAGELKRWLDAAAQAADCQRREAVLQRSAANLRGALQPPGRVSLPSLRRGGPATEAPAPRGS